MGIGPTSTIVVITKKKEVLLRDRNTNTVCSGRVADFLFLNNAPSILLNYAMNLFYRVLPIINKNFRDVFAF